MRIVGDTSALVSLGVVADREWNPLDHLLATETVLVPSLVVDELRETAAYDDPSGRGAARVLEREAELDVHDVTLDDSFPLDDGENAAVALAHDREATQLLCDEFNRLALVHASLTGARLVTSPTLLVGLARTGVVSPSTAEAMLSDLREARSWSTNSYVSRAAAVLQSR